MPALLITATGHYRNRHSGCRSGAQDAPSSLDYRFLRMATQAGIAAVIDALEVR